MIDKKEANGRLTGLLALWELLRMAAVPLAFTLGGWIVGHEIRLTSIEANRFTDQDAAAMHREILKELPPQWVREALKDLKDHHREMERQFSDLNARVKSLEK
jgi:hypothetical protein